ncbi:SDR family oxidoreductase [Pseudonocardia ailaonensis]|uniref:SDR family oxidoreductase n=1 Tax=Pseudonocardia ailaonensis TaxID=367279 RepID=A0ABN2NAN8_9PSEU
MTFSGRVAVVTGGGNGMGRACAQRLAGEGVAVVVVDVIEEAAKAAVEEIHRSGGVAEQVVGDVGDEAVIARAIDVAESGFGGPDIIIAAAGIPAPGYRSGGPPVTRPASGLERFLRTTPPDWDEVLGVNLRGVMLVVQRGVASMLEHERRGSVVVITSVSAASPITSGSVAYTASKAGAQAVVKHVSQLVADRGIRVNAVGPGLIDTNMSRGYAAPTTGPSALAHIPAGRPGTADDIADAVLFLAGEQSQFITGEVLYVDGGQFTG